jgi:leucine dehydrogenase
VHNTSRGPSIGGFRLYDYKKEWDAVFDVLRLSRGMTFKNAAIGLKHGGGKAICWLPKKNAKSKALLKAYTQFLPHFEKKYITAEDVGSSVPDMDYVYSILKKQEKIPNVLCTSKKIGGSGDPSPATVLGVFEGMKATVKYKLKKNMRGLKVALQGTGKVGMDLGKQLVDAGCIVYATARHRESTIPLEKYAKKKKKHPVIWVDPEKIYDVDCDVFCPCALGAIINDNTINRLKCTIIAGSANNQLKEEKKHGKILMKKGILYAPDFVINAGGVTSAAEEYAAHKQKRKYAWKNVEKTIKTRIPRNLIKIYNISKKEKIPTSIAALELAESRIK